MSATTPAAPDVDGIVRALGYQRQVDEDGTECGVSRQAVDEARTLLMEWRDLIERLAAQHQADAAEIANLRACVEAPDVDENGLRPCPFCGGKAMHIVGSAKPPAHYVLCTNGDCNAATAMRAFAGDAAQDWNRRVP